MKYLIGILSVLGLITIGTTLFPLGLDGVENVKARIQNVPEGTALPSTLVDAEVATDESIDFSLRESNTTIRFIGCVNSYSQLDTGPQFYRSVNMIDNQSTSLSFTYRRGGNFVRVAYKKEGLGPVRLHDISMSNGGSANFEANVKQFLVPFLIAGENGLEMDMILAKANNKKQHASIAVLNRKPCEPAIRPEY